MKKDAYDKIFHNGIYIIDAIERLQQGAEVWNVGPTKNEYQNSINFDDKRSFSRIFNKKYLQSGVNIGSALAVLTVLIGLITWGVTLRADVDHNIGDITIIKETVTDIKTDQDEIHSDVKDLTAAFKYIFRDILW